MRIRNLVVLFFCLAFLATRLGGLHFHVPDHDHPPQSGGHEVVLQHSATHLISAFAVDHLADHASHDERDISAADGLMTKLPASGLALFILTLWLVFAPGSRLAPGRRVPLEWLRPPPIRRGPALLLPPSRGPPRAI
jgi:hypothetical protein